MYDVIVIGSGPAGISASIYLKRARKNVCIITDENSALKKASKIENYYGVKPISGEELYNIGIKQVQDLNIPIVKDEVTNITLENNFIVTTVNREYEAKYVIIATGTNRTAPNVKGIKEFEGKGISYCAICDGFFYKNKTVAVVGNGSYAVSEANDLINIVSKLIILTNGAERPQIRGDNVEINSKPIKEFAGQDKIEKVEFNDGTDLKIDGAFIAQGSADSSDFARKLGIILNDNKIKVDENMETNIKGIFACGDCIGGTLQISKAVDDGMVAGLSVIKYLKIH